MCRKTSRSASPRSVAIVTVGQEHGAHVVEAPADAGEKDLDAPARDPGVHEQAASVRFYVRRVARATAREDTQSQDLPFSLRGWAREDLSTALIRRGGITVDSRRGEPGKTVPAPRG